MNHPSKYNDVKYADKKLGWIIYPLLGVSFIFFANDNDFGVLIRLPSFKWDVLFSLAVVSIVGFYLAWLTRYLDKSDKHSWETATKRRLLTQCFYGILVPLFFSIGLEILYLAWLGIPLSESSILNLEMPLSFIFLLLINLLYYLNFIVQAKLREPIQIPIQSPEREKIVITQGAKEIPLHLDQVLFIRSFEKHTWLHTIDHNQSILSGTLSEWEEKLPKANFYRLNRKYIAHRNAIQSIETTETRRIRVFLNDYQDEVFVPKTKATDFRRWLKK